MEDAMIESKIVKPKQRPASTQEQLHAAFTAVQNKDHWKNAINALIDPADQDVTGAAIMHFAYGNASFTPAANGKLRVRAPGYYAMEARLGS
jgi:hypothetical protein